MLGRVKVVVQLVRTEGGAVAAYLVNSMDSRPCRLYRSRTVRSMDVAKQLVSRLYDPAKVEIIWEQV